MVIGLILMIGELGNAELMDKLNEPYAFNYAKVIIGILMAIPFAVVNECTDE